MNKVITFVYDQTLGFSYRVTKKCLHTQLIENVEGFPFVVRLVEGHGSQNEQGDVPVRKKTQQARWGFYYIKFLFPPSAFY